MIAYMHILYVVEQFPKLSESFVINEIYELEKRGHTVSVFSTSSPEEAVTHTEVEKVDVVTEVATPPSIGLLPGLFSEEVLNLSVLRKALFINEPLRHAYWLHLGKQISEMVERIGGVDIIHGHFAVPRRLGAVYAAAYHDVPCTVTAHAVEIFAPRDVRGLKRVLSRVDHIVVPSEYNRRYLSGELGVETEMSVVPATTRVDKFDPSGGCVPGRLLTVARLTEKKGYEYAIDAVAELVEQGYDVEYHIVGTGELEESLRARVEERGIGACVEFLGNVSDSRLRSELHDAEVFVLPCVIAANGDRDVAPVALKEAMASRTACVSTSISAIPELITDGQDGVLVEPNDPIVLSDVIADLLDDAEYRQRIAEAGYETVREKFDISTSVDKLVAVFRSETGAPKPNPG
jgi:glycosyltransferase involved in cell wall biosynthesis